MRVLVVQRDILIGQDEAGEVEQQVAGLVAAGVAVRVSDGRLAWRVAPGGDGMDLSSEVALAAAMSDTDLVHIHLPLPALRPIRAALAARRRGLPVVFSPMGMLSRDFGRTSWFRRRGRVGRVGRRFGVIALRAVWRRLADTFVCLSEHEVRTSGLDPDRCVLVPWPVPHSELARAAGSGGRLFDPRGPVAFVSRMDVHRKGIDRLCAWLETAPPDAPRPAVRLLAPAPALPPRVAALVTDGLIAWDPAATGRLLRERLRGTRGVMLLSRWDGQPRVLREAAALGLPTLSTSASNFTEIVRCLGEGAVVDGDDPHSVREGFVLLARAGGDPEPALRLLDRAAIGRFLGRVYAAQVAGDPVDADYYTSAAQSTGASEG